MIHEAKIVFHNREYFNFTRKQDADQFQLEKEHDLLVMVDRNYLTFLIDNENPLCRIKTRMIDFNPSKAD